MKKRISPCPLRMPDNLRAWIQERAIKSGRSLNAEINQMLKRYKEEQAEQQINT